MQKLDTFGFFDYTSGSDYEYTGVEESERIALMQGNGVVIGNQNEFEVTAGTGLEVNIDTGAIFIEGRWGILKTAITQDIDAESAGVDRIDSIVATMDNTTNYAIGIDVVQGSASVSPTPPTLAQTDSYYELELAQVYVTGGSTAITVTDERTYAGTAKALAAAMHTVTGVTVTNIGWTASGDFYYKNISDAWFDGSSSETVDVYPAQASYENASVLTGRAETQSGSIRLWALSVPDGDIVIDYKGQREVR